MLPLGLLACAAAGLVAATGRASVALALVALAILGGLAVLERRRLAPLLWAGVAFTAPLQGVRVVGGLALSDILILGALVTILPDSLPGWRRVVPAGVLPAFCVLVFAGLIGTFFAPDAGASLANLVRLVPAAAGSVAAMALWDPGRERLRRFAWLWLAGATTSGMWAMARPRVFGQRAIGLANHPNHFGLICLLGIGLGLGLALSSTGRARVAGFASVGVLAVGIGLSGSRSAILGGIVTIGLTALLSRRFRLLAASVALTLLGGTAFIVGLLRLPESSAISRLVGGGGSAVSDIERKRRLAEAVASINRHPFTGEGFEFAQAAHNIYLQALVVGGPLALASFLCISGLILRAGMRATRAERSHREGPLLAGLTAGYAGYLFSGLIAPILWDRYLWTYVGLLLLLAATRPTGSATTGRYPPRAGCSGAGAAPPPAPCPAA